MFVLGDARRRLGAISERLKARLSPYALSCIRAAYAPGGADTPDAVIAALLFAEPLSTLLARMEHEWVRDALLEGWFFSVFHPIVDARTGSVFAQEALIRAHDPETGRLIGAGPIIKACENLNLQHQLDRCARQAAIRGAAAAVSESEKVFINFLPNAIYDPKICLRTTMETAAECGMPLNRLVFEVVESEQIPDMKRLCHILDYYRERGVGTAIDDMGAGFSSLEYLSALRPDYVKLDRDLIVNAEHDAETRYQMEHIVDVAKNLSIRVIAEGIETETQMRLCLESGVDYMQGFLFAKPANPPQRIADYLQPSRRLAA